MIFASRFGWRLGFVITKPAEFLQQIVRPEIDSGIEQIRVRINLGREAPLWSLKFCRDRFLEPLEIPAAKNDPAGGDDEKRNEEDTKDSKFGPFQT